jgi:hypothetical protein
MADHAGLGLVEEVAASIAGGVEKKYEKKSWWNSFKAVLFYGPAVLIAIYLIGFFLGVF